VQFYDAASGGTALGAAYTGNVTVSPSGVFNLPLTPPPGIFTAAEVWYELGIDTDEPVDNSAADDVFNGRIQVQSVPFALQAAEAGHVALENVGDGSISQTELSALEGITSSIQAQFDLLGTGAGDFQDALDALNAEQDAQDTAIALRAVAGDVYTKVEIDGQQGTQDNAIAAKADASDVYTKTEIDGQQGTQDTTIAAKADASDVYTKTESDSNFVAVVGDTMTGALAISDSTASTSDSTGALTVAGGAGVGGDLNVGGEASADALTLASAGAPPGVTTDKLYNVGGALFFDGTELNAGGALGSSIESSEITDGTIATEDIANNAVTTAKLGFLAVENAQLAASAVTTSKVANGTITNLKLFDNAVTSIKIQNDEIVDADINSSANISTSKLNANVVVSGEGNAQLTNDAGYLTAEADTLTAVTGRGASTSTQITLNGGVRTDTVSEVTAANGVSVDGVKLKDSFVELSSIAAPSPTTNRLYNEGGTLKFNGTALGGGGGTKYTFINWDTYYLDNISGASPGRNVFIMTMPFAGTVVSVQSYCTDVAGATGACDIRKNGSSIIGGGLVHDSFFTDSTLKDHSGLLTGATFSAGDTLSFFYSATTGTVLDASITLIVTY
jgi:hypothetical protein